MKAIIFAGGMGTRLWPLSRRDSPKQFEKVIGDKSTLQLAVERLLPDFEFKDIFIATYKKYIPIISQQLPNIAWENIISEPEMRDVGPAVGLVTAWMYKKFPKEPIIILWSDHLVGNEALFGKIIKESGRLISKHRNKIVFISQKPRFASQNLGWIKYSEVVKVIKNIKFYTFLNFCYRPTLTQALEFYKSGRYSWNLGYFVTTPAFLWKLYQKHQPQMYQQLKIIYQSVNTGKFTKTVDDIYPKLKKISFDEAILEKIGKNDAWVVSQALNWSDVGTWEALKEAMQSSPSQNVISGKVLVTDCRDTLVYNYTDQLITTIDLDGLLVINTKDVVLICHKNSVPKIKKLVKKLAQSEDKEHLV